MNNLIKQFLYLFIIFIFSAHTLHAAHEEIELESSFVPRFHVLQNVLTHPGKPCAEFYDCHKAFRCLYLEPSSYSYDNKEGYVELQHVPFFMLHLTLRDAVKADESELNEGKFFLLRKIDTHIKKSLRETSSFETIIVHHYKIDTSTKKLWGSLEPLCVYKNSGALNLFSESAQSVALKLKQIEVVRKAQKPERWSEFNQYFLEK